MQPAGLVTAWLERAELLERYAPHVAAAFRDCAAELERTLRDDESEALTLAEAALASGYSAEHLRHLIARGELQNAGRRGAPRVRRGDLPRKAKGTPTGYDPAADALQLHRASRR